MKKLESQTAPNPPQDIAKVRAFLDFLLENGIYEEGKLEEAIEAAKRITLCHSRSDAITSDIDYGRLAYEKHIETYFVSIPREGMQTATWDELGDKIQDEWRRLAKTIIRAFVEQALKDVY